MAITYLLVGVAHHNHTDEIKKKISKSNIGRVISQESIELRRKSMIGKKHTLEHNKKIAESTSKVLKKKYQSDTKYREKIDKNLELARSKLSNKDTTGENNPFFGKKHSEDMKEKYLYRSVLCIETGEIFKSINDAAAKYNIRRTGITAVCSGRNLRCGGYRWKYIDEPKVPKNFSKNKSGKPGKKVVCIETGEIFNTIKNAADRVGLFNGSLISKCCNGTKKSAKGYHWKYL